MSAPDLKTVPVNFIRFHGLTLLVVENGGVEYVAVKPISDMLGLAWRKVRDTVMSGDNVELYGTKRLLPPSFDVYGGDVLVPENTENPPDLDGEGAKNREPLVQGALLYIRLDCAQFFLSGVNTNKVRANGRTATADKLLAVKKEWAKALHDYETLGVARKRSNLDDLKALQGLIKTRTLVETPQERAALSLVIARVFVDLGVPLGEDPQGALDLHR